MTDETTLSPPGLQDVLPQEAERERTCIETLLRCFRSYGYDEVKPPLMEYESSLLSAENQNMSSYTLRLMDPASDHMLAIRPDMTIQVARLAALRLKQEPRPLRLCYAGQVLRARGEGLYAERQLTQAGAECIGETAPNADAEVILLAVEGLTALGITNISVDFSLPQLSTLLLETLDLPQENISTLLDAVEKKDEAQIRSLLGDPADLWTSLIATGGSTLEVAIPALQALTLPESAEPLLTTLQAITTIIAERAPDIRLTIDPLERRGFEYHTGTAFSLFSLHSKEELGRGGRYQLPNNQEHAVGFSYSVNALQRVMPAGKAPERVYAPYAISTSRCAALREDGYIVIQGLQEEQDALREAKRLGCTHLADETGISSL